MDKQELLNRYQQGDRNFRGIDLSGADLSWQDLSNANFANADFYGATLRGTQLAHADLSEAHLAYVNLEGANLSEANLNSAHLDNATLEGANLQSALYNDQTKFPYGFDAIAAGCTHAKNVKPPAAPPASTPPAPEPPLENAPQPEPTPPAEVNRVFVNTSPAADIPSTTAPNPSDSSTPPKSKHTLWIIIGSAIAVFLGGWIALYGSRSNLGKNPFATVSFPRPACGDSIPAAKSFPISFYPVYVDYSSGSLAKIRAQYCKDAYPITRQDTGRRAVQVASFTSASRAKDFAAFMMEKLGSGEVGSPRRVKRIDDL
jgi:hypothetical protein